MIQAGQAVIDVHTHVAPLTLEALAARGQDLPHLILETAASGRFCCGYAKPRPLDERSWNAQRRLDDMGARQVERQVISPIPMTYAYSLDAALCADFWRAQNDGVAQLVASNPTRFSGLCGVPLQDVDRALAELERAIGELGLIGVEIGTHVNGVDLDDARFAPFWAGCEALGAMVFIHPEGMAGPERVTGRLEPSVGYPVETGIAAAKLMAAGLFRRHPRLDVLLAHGGGALPWLLPRMDQAWSRFADMKEGWEARPSDLARRFHYDALTFDPLNLRLIIDRLGDDRVMVGSDYPFSLAEDPPGAVLRALEGIDEARRRRMLYGNAADLIGRCRGLNPASP